MHWGRIIFVEGIETNKTSQDIKKELFIMAVYGERLRNSSFRSKIGAFLFGRKQELDPEAMVESLNDVEEGSRLGPIHKRGYDGELEATVGEISLGRIPERSVLASANTQTYVASVKRDERRGKDRIAIALQDTGDHEALIGLGALDQHKDIKVPADLLQGALSIAMRREGFVVGRFVGANHIATPDQVVEQAGFKPNDSGELVFAPSQADPIAPQPTLW